eukprot:scaffold1700_cov259-Pinguiococcus_pyrenoidosus.AAC.3
MMDPVRCPDNKTGLMGLVAKRGKQNEILPCHAIDTYSLDTLAAIGRFKPWKQGRHDPHSHNLRQTNFEPRRRSTSEARPVACHEARGTWSSYCLSLAFEA